jgi:hypothetical protein
MYIKGYASMDFDGIQSVLCNRKNQAAEAIPGWQINRSGTPEQTKRLGVRGLDLPISEGNMGFFEVRRSSP